MKAAKTESLTVLTGVVLCFALSGFAALLYQTAWMRQLSTVFGASELAVATVLAAYMAGLSLGAAIAARLMHKIRRPILVYGALEAAIAISAIAVPFLLQLAGIVYAALFGGSPHLPDASGYGQPVFYLAATFLVLLIPTACMGATLPMVTRYAVHKDEEIGSRVGLLYSVNTAGAILGTLIAAFVLLPALGLWGTIAVGAVVNLLVFGVAALLAARAASESVATARRVADFGWRPESWVLPIMLLSGSAAFVYEVLWTRLLSHVLGGSVVAFATMLASFLSGIAIGSAIASRIAKTRAAAQTGLVIAELGVAVTSVAIFLALDRYVPETAGMLGNVSTAVALLLPATLFIGATFPFAVRILSRDASEASAASARVYSWNTVGAIVGALLAGFVMIPMLKYEGAIKVAVIINVGLAFIAAVAIPPRRTVLAAGSAAVFAVLFIGFSPAPPEGILRVSPLNDLRSGDIRFYGVGRSATVLMLERDGYFYLRSNGLSEAAIDLKGAPPSKHTQSLLATLPVLARPDSKSMLIIGFGGGVVAEDISPSIADIDIVELEPKVVDANLVIGSDRSIDPLGDPRINLVINDARNSLRLTDRSYDIIVSQPSHPWTAGASHLYTREFMMLVKARLARNGVLLQWMNTQFLSEPLLRSFAATLLDVFPHVRVYQPDTGILFFLASESPLQPEAEILATGEPFKSRPGHVERKGIGSVNDLVAALAWDESGLRRLAGGASLITDNNNQLAMQSALAFADSALPFSRLQALIVEHGVLFDPRSDFHGTLAPAIDYLYVLDRLDSIHAGILTASLEETLAAGGNNESRLREAKVLQKRGLWPQADRALLAVLDSEPQDPVASYMLLRSRGDALLDGTLPVRLHPIVRNLTDVAAAVIEAAEYAERRDLSHARNKDELLALARPWEQWYLDAAKLRADWRIVAASEGAGAKHAVDALAIIDRAIALRQDIDFYGMRMAAAFLSDNYEAVVETARRMVWLVRQDFEFRVEEPGWELSAREVRQRLTRLDAIRTGLSIVRESGRVADRKFDALDRSTAELRQELELYRAQP